MERIGTLQGIVTLEEGTIVQLADGNGDPNAIARATEEAQPKAERARNTLGALMGGRSKSTSLRLRDPAPVPVLFKALLSVLGSSVLGCLLAGLGKPYL
jgi:hypothetical protein